MLAFLMMINFIDKTSLGLAAQPIIDELGLTLSQYGWINSGFFAFFSLTALLIGFVADRFSTKWIIAILAGVWGVAQISVVAASSFTVLLILRMVLGAAEGPTYPIVNHAAYTWLTDRDRSLASSIITAGGSVGVLAGVPLLTYFIVDYGWRSAFLVSGLISLAFCILWLMVGKEGPLSSNAPPTSADSLLDGLDVRPNYWQTVRTGTFLASVAAGFAAYWVIGNALAFSPLYLHAVLGLSASGVAQVTMAIQVFTITVAYVGQGILTRWLLTRGISTRWARGVIGGICLIIAGVAHVGFVFVPSLPIKIFLACLTHLSSSMFAISQTVCAEISHRGQRGRILGTYGALYPLAGVISPVVTGYLASSLGTAHGLQVAWVVTSVLLFIAGAAAIAFIRPDRDVRRLMSATPTPDAPARLS
ncbi:MFS transporter [Nocardia australiensis]|uniref:MFS transporter n=1 Tax=Nocardia australiensis TaxID=2887191 RepID=UPI001D143CF6|nr:MFS transporter [Nocardia australiensis]